MSKRNLKNLFWFSKEFVYILLLILPFLCYALYHIHQTPNDLISFLSQNFINLDGSFLYNTFDEVYSLMFSTDDTYLLCWFSSYFVMIELIHLVLDVILLLPSIMKRFLRRLTDE